MKGLILKYKWHLISLVLFTVIGAAILYRLFAGKSGSGKAVQEVAQWALDKRLKMVKEEISRNRAKKGELEGDLKEVEAKIEAVEREREEVGEKVDKRSLKELDDAWEKLGY